MPAPVRPEARRRLRKNQQYRRSAGLPPRRAGTPYDKKAVHNRPHVGLRGVGERSEPTRERESVAGRARPPGARTPERGKAPQRGKPATMEERVEAARAATRPNRKRRYRKRGRRRALAHSSYRGAAGGRESAGVWRHGGEMPPSSEGKGCRRSQGRSAPSQQPKHITRATRRGGSHTAAASVTRAHRRSK